MKREDFVRCFEEVNACEPWALVVFPVQECTRLR
jgi:hypothetical protein